jgi:uncharacterized protein
MKMIRAFLLLALLLCAPTAWAQTFPKFEDSGVVDAANLLDPAQKQALSAKLIAQKKASGRSLMVATIPDLQGYDIRDYGYRLGRAWGVGDKNSNGALLIVAPAEHKMRIEVGYGLEGILTDALSSQIVRNTITPHFKAGDMVGGINAGVDEISSLLALPPDQAKQRALQAEEQARSRNDDGGGGIIAFWIILFIIFFVVLPLMSRARGGKRYRRGGGVPPVIIWGPGSGGSGWGSGSGGSGWGGSSWGGGDSGGGGFSGGGSFGGGGASGDW